MGRIVVGIDGSEGSAVALRWAMEESHLRGWSVLALMAWGDEDEPEDAHIDLAVAETVTARALDTFVSEELSAEDAAVVERQVTRGLPVPTILAAAEGAELLVVGARGLGGFRGLLLGSVSQSCLHRATGPVAIVRKPEPHEAGPSQRIVVGVDGSASSQAALAYALDEARLRGARVDAVHSWASPFVGGTTVALPVDPAPFEQAAQAVLDAALDRADTRGLTHPVEKILVPGGAAALILDVARGADLIVVGTHGRGTLRGLVLGSVSNQVVHHAPCPMVVVPAPAD